MDSETFQNGGRGGHEGKFDCTKIVSRTKFCMVGVAGDKPLDLLNFENLESKNGYHEISLFFFCSPIITCSIDLHYFEEILRQKMQFI